MDKDNGYIIKSLLFGLEVLQVISEAEDPLLLSEVAKKTATNMVRATRVVRTFEKAGYIYRDSNKKYHLTPKMLSLGYSFIKSVEWIDLAQYHMTSLYDEIGGIVSLSVLDDQNIVYLSRIRDKEFISMSIHVGAKLPVHCTGMGKIMLAYSPKEEVARVLDKIDFKTSILTSFTISSREAFEAELSRAAQLGYALNDEELALGNRAIGAPILNENGYAVAAIGVSMQTLRHSREEIEQKLSPAVMACAKKISEDLQTLATSMNVSVDHFVRQNKTYQSLSSNKSR